MLSSHPPPQRQTNPPSSSNQMILLSSKQAPNHSFGELKPATSSNTPAAATAGKLSKNYPTRARSSGRLLPVQQRTNPLIWCAAFCCIIFSLLLILSGVATLIIFLVIKPKHPSFEVTAATLNSIYIDSSGVGGSSSEYFNGDFSFIANLSNPNGKMDISYEYLDIELYFWDKLIGTQALQPFDQKQGEARLGSVHMISSEISLPLNHSILLRKQVQSNRVRYDIRGTFRVRAVFGLTHFSYWLYGRCQVLMSGPPNGVLVARSCRTTR